MTEKMDLFVRTTVRTILSYSLKDRFWEAVKQLSAKQRRQQVLRVSLGVEKLMDAWRKRRCRVLPRTCVTLLALLIRTMYRDRLQEVEKSIVQV